MKTQMKTISRILTGGGQFVFLAQSPLQILSMKIHTQPQIKQVLQNLQAIKLPHPLAMSNSTNLLLPPHQVVKSLSKMLQLLPP